MIDGWVAPRDYTFRLAKSVERLRNHKIRQPATGFKDKPVRHSDSSHFLPASLLSFPGRMSSSEGLFLTLSVNAPAFVTTFLIRNQ